MTRTYSAKEADIKRKWYVVDAEGKTLGRLATQVAIVLRGKHKPIFTPHVDTGDHVIVVNAEKIHLTGDKVRQKTYYRHSGYPGGLKSETVKDLLERKPYVIVERAIKGMLPKTKLGKQMARKLNVYAGPTHPHKAQQPETMAV
ncbi:MAG: 50S ribosomal protein L13 [Nitrospiraceae bacterium]|jgi:large subunit ribosomal protein L13|nr:MAG: 50S ribosomal protein L13 [Nitrospiraceae bacterium]